MGSSNSPRIINIDDDSDIISRTVSKVAVANPERNRNVFDKMRDSVGASSNDTFSKLPTIPVVTYFYKIIM